ncbi:MAG: hypothetical protein M3R39_02495 [Actinomycetota bacterium]|nr:hypothetical protein [Actinomycetota bacterium]
MLVAGGCDHAKRRAEPPPAHRQSFLALDAEQQRLVADYQPVSRALTSYELAYRDWLAGRISKTLFLRRAAGFRGVAARSLSRVRRDPASGETRRAKELLVSALESRRSALTALPRLNPYERDWDRSVAEARRALTILQDIRDRARLIPLPEDSVS